MTTDRIPVAWLRRTIEARLALARHAASRGSEWHTGCTCVGECRGYPSCDTVTGDGIHIYPEGGHDADQATHIAANDPQDTIARCEAELAILDLCERVIREDDGRHDGCGAVDAWSGLAVARLALALLATGYRHADGYREEDWRADESAA